MAAPSELTALGMPHSLANRLAADAVLALVAAGTTQADATAALGGFVEVATAGSNTGIILPAAPSTFVVSNGGANAVKVYPPVGSYMNGTINAAFSVTNAKTAIFYRSGNRYIGVLSA